MKKRFSYLLLIGFIGLIGFVITKTFQEKNGLTQEDTPPLSTKEKTSDGVITPSALATLVQPSMVLIGNTKQQNFPGRPTQILENQINRVGYGIAVDTGKVLTAGHLFDDNNAFYVMKVLKDGAIISIDNIWKNGDDLALTTASYPLIPYAYVITPQTFTAKDLVFSYTDARVLIAHIIEFDNGQIITNLPYEPGKSGSPLFNEHGVLIGINTAISEENGKVVTYAQPIPIPFSTSFPVLDE